jgi:sulfotransferase
MSSPVAAMFGGLQNMLSGRNEFHVFIDDAKREAILKAIFTSYYQDIHPHKLVFDTNRAWCSKIHALATLFPEAKVICCVRSLLWVLDSFERIVRRNALEPSRMFNYEAGGNVYTRTESHMAPAGVVGGSYSGLRDAFYSEASDRLMLVTYESLTNGPGPTMEGLYDFIGEETFSHDFNNVEFDAEEFDVRLGTRGLHKVSPKVEFRERTSILPPDIQVKYQNSDFWQRPHGNPRGVRVI